MLEVIQTNLGAPALLGELYYPFLLRGTKKTIVNVTTGLASLGLDCGPKCTSYSISKCALNMLVRITPSASALFPRLAMMHRFCHK